jgi:hypothetical protein
MDNTVGDHLTYKNNFILIKYWALGWSGLLKTVEDWVSGKSQQQEIVPWRLSILKEWQRHL